MIRMRYIGGGWIEAVGQTLRSHTPAFAMARRLLDQGYPPATEVVVIAQSGTPSLRGTLGGFAALTVKETDGAPCFARYVPFPADRMRPGRPQGAEPTPGATEAVEAAQHATSAMETA